ncbi:unnamed protein product [Ambrosiozyma monospora]|uniref:Unnamed protein product n=1 Tax=Ambrosiozyma monospora TaxID=43982 RepID=A0A9W6SZY3_AMBMO|nr:unnamed protein product [Ambrosiozyma monospora]
MFKCISRYTKINKLVGQTHPLQRHYTQQSELLSPENVEDISYQLKSDLIKRLKRQNEQHGQSSTISWLDAFHKDNSADQTIRINEIKKAFHRFSRPWSIENLKNNPITSFFYELDKVEDQYTVKVLSNVKDEKLAMVFTKNVMDRYNEIFDQLNTYGNLDLKEGKCGIVDSSQFSLRKTKFITMLNKIQVGENGEVVNQDSKISELVQKYLELPVPRLVNFHHDQIVKFRDVVTEGFTVRECFQVSGAILKDIQESSKPFTHEEYVSWIDKLFSDP